MRPIDADAFKDDLDYICGAGGCLEPITSAVIKFVKERIAQQPTIKPRKGKWFYNQLRGTTKIWTCSRCGWNEIGEFNFCPNCGADMRQEEEQ